MANTVNNPSGGSVDGGGARPFDWGSAFPTVTCPDGTKDIANGIAPPCMGKYGNQKQNDEMAELQIENARKKAIEDYQKRLQENNAKEPIYYILVTAGVLIAGYFAYKKFKK
jgi:hypothetical protein